MTPAADRFLADLLKLPPADRGEVVERLLDSLEPASDADAEGAWSEQIRSRIEDIRSGRITAIPWKEAREQILADDDGSP